MPISPPAVLDLNKGQMITVYLDSQDYSTLTDPKQLTPTLLQLRDALRDYAKSGQVQFVFSGVVISEIAPLTPGVASLAEAKATLLSDLCRTNALVPAETLMTMEAKALFGQSSLTINPFDLRGNWFPDFPPLFERGLWREMEVRIHEDLKGLGVSRQQRRAQARKFIKGGQPRPFVRSQFAQHDSATMMQGFLESYPIAPEQTEVLLRYCKGQATDSELDNAVRESMRDPKLIMRWLSSDVSLMSPVAELVRRPGREMGEQLRRLAVVSKTYAESLLNQGSSKSLAAMAKEWEERILSQISSVIRALAKHQSLPVPPSFSDTEVLSKCPGLATMFGAMYSRVWSNVAGGMKREVGDSLAVDAMHALYAPYVDIFRADREMSPHIAKQLTQHKTTVVSKREELPAAIEQLLKAFADTE